MITEFQNEFRWLSNFTPVKITLNGLEFSSVEHAYMSKLKETGTQIIQEGNKWNDKFWGVCLKTNQGENHLGKMIMKIRNEIQFDDQLDRRLI